VSQRKAVHTNISPTSSGEHEGGFQRKAVRHDGWTEERRERFLAVLADSSNIKAALEEVGKTYAGFYSLRRRDPDFHQSFEEAMEEGYARLELELLERARFGVDRPVYYREKKIAVARSFSDAMALKVLQRRDDLVERVRARRSADVTASAEQEDILQALRTRIEALRERRLNASAAWYGEKQGSGNDPA
jgi:hypothetical protein